MFESKNRPGMAMTEVAIGITLAAIAIFIAIGLFNDNLSGMITSSNLDNFFKGNDTKTYYTPFERDYSDSQINVQLIGEQGLQMLRRKANNKAINQIADVFSGVDTSTTNANSIGYLALAIKAIVGKPDICVYMKKDSTKFCNEDSIGGFTYKIDSSSSTLTINKVDTAGNSLGETKVLTIGNELSGILSSKNVPLQAESRSALTDNEKYELIKDISIKSEPYVYSHVILIRFTNTFTSTKKTIDVTPALTTILDELKTSLKSAHDRCTTHGILSGYDYDHVPLIFPPSGCTPPLKHGTAKGSNKGFVDKSELSEFNSWAQVMSGNINASGSKDASEMINLFLQHENINRIVDILKNDHKNNPTSCDIFKNGLNNIISTYKLTISVPECIPNDI